MSMNIKNKEAYELTKQLAKLTGESPLMRIQSAFEKAGIHFLDNNPEGVGVRLAAPTSRG